MSSRLKRLLGDRRALYYYFQKAIRSFPIRRAIAWFIAGMSRRAEQSGSDDLRIAEELESEGFSFLHDLISPKQIIEVKAYLSQLKCRDVTQLGATPSQTAFHAPEDAPKGCRRARFDEVDLLGCPHLLEIANDPRILGALQRVFRCAPTISIFEAWWSFAGIEQPGSGGAYQDQMYHRDLEDFRFAKLFIYLTDVDDAAGPHVFVRGSHAKPMLMERRPLRDQEILAAFGEEKVLTYRGKEGTAFLEDTFGVHRGSPPMSKHRLIFSVTYSLTALNPQSPRSPLARLKPGLDPYTNRVFLN
jgi:hypothetical protein